MRLSSTPVTSRAFNPDQFCTSRVRSASSASRSPRAKLATERHGVGADPVVGGEFPHNARRPAVEAASASPAAGAGCSICKCSLAVSRRPGGRLRLRALARVKRLVAHASKLICRVTDPKIKSADERGLSEYCPEQRRPAT